MSRNLKILVLSGVPASGKSTWAKSFLAKNPNYVRVSRDDFRFMLRNQGLCENKIESMITSLQMNTIKEALNKRLNVVIDDTNLREKYINPFIKAFNHRADFEFMLFDISYKKALERDNNRERKVGEEVLKRMYKNYEVFKDSFHFQNMPQLKREEVAKQFIEGRVIYDSKLKDCVICDVDGTLAIMNRHPFDWKKVDKDYPNKAVIDRINDHYRVGTRVVLMSGRDNSSRELTEKWLKENGINYHELHMRGDLYKGDGDDYRKDNIVKEELYNEYIKDKYNVLVVYDDRQQVVDLWRSLGLDCFQVAASPD
jgi:predicted kinase